ncbi:MAG: hypothetical protein AAF432_03610 [Planctomycetota bacterium]
MSHRITTFAAFSLGTAGACLLMGCQQQAIETADFESNGQPRFERPATDAWDYKFVFHPDASVYYEPYTRQYYWQENGQWFQDSTLPSTLQLDPRTAYVVTLPYENPTVGNALEGVLVDESATTESFDMSTETFASSDSFVQDDADVTFTGDDSWLETNESNDFGSVDSNDFVADANETDFASDDMVEFSSDSNEFVADTQTEFAQNDVEQSQFDQNEFASSSTNQSSTSNEFMTDDEFLPTGDDVFVTNNDSAIPAPEWTADDELIFRADRDEFVASKTASSFDSNEIASTEFNSSDESFDFADDSNWFSDDNTIAQESSEWSSTDETSAASDWEKQWEQFEQAETSTWDNSDSNWQSEDDVVADAADDQNWTVQDENDLAFDAIVRNTFPIVQWTAEDEANFRQGRDAMIFAREALMQSEDEVVFSAPSKPGFEPLVPVNVDAPGFESASEIVHFPGQQDNGIQHFGEQTGEIIYAEIEDADADDIEVTSVDSDVDHPNN